MRTLPSGLLVTGSMIGTLYLPAQDVLDPLSGTTFQGCMLDAPVEPYPAIREADVMWARRVWREIDLKEPVNGPLRVPEGESARCHGLFAIIRHGLLEEGCITAYDPGPLGKDDAFTTRMSLATLVGSLSGPEAVSAVQVSRYRIKEDWIFNKESGRMEVRIIGLAPLVEVRGDLGELRGHRPLFWLYFPECRPLFARWVAFHEGTDLSPSSYDVLFAKRRFSSMIIKVGNGMDRGIGQVDTGLDALLEGLGVREQLFQLGFDLWNY